MAPPGTPPPRSSPAARDREPPPARAPRQQAAVVEGTLASFEIRPPRLYRSLRQETPWLLGAVPALAIGLAAPTLGVDPLLLRWATPLRTAAVAGGTALLASALLSPALLLLARGAAERVRTARARGRVFRALIGDDDLAGFGRRYRITARVRTLEGIRLRAVARPGDPLGGEEIEPNLEEAYLAEINYTPAP